MATKAIIGATQPDGTIHAVMVWADGYPEHTGEILAKYYNSQRLADELIKGGDIRALKQTVERCDYYKNRKGEDWEKIKPQTFLTIEQFLNNESCADYRYIFQENGWLCKE